MPISSSDCVENDFGNLYHHPTPWGSSAGGVWALCCITLHVPRHRFMGGVGWCSTRQWNLRSIDEVQCGKKINPYPTVFWRNSTDWLPTTHEKKCQLGSRMPLGIFYMCMFCEFCMHNVFPVYFYITHAFHPPATEHSTNFAMLPTPPRGPWHHRSSRRSVIASLRWRHLDGTARHQSVSSRDEPWIHALLMAVGKRIGLVPWHVILWYEQWMVDWIFVRLILMWLYTPSDFVFLTECQ